MYVTFKNGKNINSKGRGESTICFEMLLVRLNTFGVTFKTAFQVGKKSGKVAFRAIQVAACVKADFFAVFI
jgi:hypothetical protein